MMTRYFVDGDGKYLGGFDGVTVRRREQLGAFPIEQSVRVTEKRAVPRTKVDIVEGRAVRSIVSEVKDMPVIEEFPLTDEDGKPVLDAKGRPAVYRREKTQMEIVGVEPIFEERDDYLFPKIPEGAVEVPAPPAHGWMRWNFVKRQFESTPELDAFLAASQK